MNEEPLFGLSTGFLSKQMTGLVSIILRKKYSILPNRPIPLSSDNSALYPGLGLISTNGKSPVASGLIVGSIRMGYGHHRMALSVYSHSLAKKIPTYLHDLLAIESNEAKAISDIDSSYSYLSRLSTDLGGAAEWAWGQFLKQGNLTSLELSVSLADSYKNIMQNLPKDNPVISTHPLNGQIAVASGFKNVVHLICDNHPQYYLLVPGALNLVQSPSCYMKFLEMGVPKENLSIAGHWVSEDIAKNAISDSEARIKRITYKKRRRFLIPIGGAGAQKGYIKELIHLTKHNLLDKKCYFWINTGDHNKVLNSLESYLNSEKIPYESILNWEDLKKFISISSFKEEEKDKLPSVVLFNFSNHTEAFSATEKLIRLADVLVTKPSELAFYPIPKLFIRRVGDHEAGSVSRSLELGEGTVECREPEHAADLLGIFASSEEPLLRMNERVIKSSEDGIYNGSKVAVEMVEKFIK